MSLSCIVCMYACVSMRMLSIRDPELPRPLQGFGLVPEPVGLASQVLSLTKELVIHRT